MLNTTLPTTTIDKESTASTSFGLLPEHRLSGSIISPPPYEPTSTVESSPMHDEKHSINEEPHISGVYGQELAPYDEAGIKQVYAEPPPTFSRIPAVNTRILIPFDPLTVLIEGSGRSLDKGFSLELPHSFEDIHPFAKRDIKATDWLRFMQDLRDGTAMSNCTKQRTLLIPIAIGLGPGAFFVSKAVKAQLRRKKLAYAIKLVNIWNQHFFNPRRVEVILMRGSCPLTISKSLAQPESPGHNSQDDNLSWVSKSSHNTSNSPSLEASKSSGCCSQSKTPMRIIVASI